MPSLSRTPARSTEPAVGASVWASGSQVWNGNIGVFTAKAMAKPRNSHRPVFVARLSLAMILVKSKLTRAAVARLGEDRERRRSTRA